MQHRRFHYIDFLRVVAILLMHVFHVAMIFVAEWGWHIKNNERSNILLELNFWMSQFRMPLLFFVSGYISFILLQRLHWRQFTWQRFLRLIIPTLAGTFLLVAPQIYFERLLLGQFKGSYFEFYSSFLNISNWYPKGNFHWLHLWFIPYLFCYNILSITVFNYLSKENALTRFLQRQFTQVRSMFGFILLAIIPYAALRLHFPDSYDLINDWARHSFFIFFVLAGLLYFRFPSLSELTEKYRRTFLSLACLSIVFINVLRWNQWEPSHLWSDWRTHPITYLFFMLHSFNSWMWVMALLGYGKKYGNRSSKVLTYANQAVYPFYILHQTAIVIIGYYVVRTKDDVSLKFMFILLVTFAICLLTYHLFIRPYNFMRFLFGMKPLKKREEITKQKEGETKKSNE